MVSRNNFVRMDFWKFPPMLLACNILAKPLNKTTLKANQQNKSSSSWYSLLLESLQPKIIIFFEFRSRYY